MEQLTYENAIKELNEIIAKIESGTLAISDSIKLIERAKELLVFCYKELDRTKGKLTEIKETLNSLEEK